MSSDWLGASPIPLLVGSYISRGAGDPGRPAGRGAPDAVDSRGGMMGPPSDDLYGVLAGSR
eukprot:5415763-Heterocapsa_arctica.AAC.1